VPGCNPRPGRKPDTEDEAIRTRKRWKHQSVGGFDRYRPALESRADDRGKQRETPAGGDVENGAAEC
jgi:hypothetical protein